MNLTIEQLAKRTKLSVSTIRVYTQRKNLGKKIGNRRVFSQADVQKLLKGSKKLASKKSKAPAKKRAKRAVKKQAVREAKPKATTPEANVAALQTKKPSFLTLLFRRKGNQGNVSIMDAKTLKLQRENAARIKKALTHSS